MRRQPRPGLAGVLQQVVQRGNRQPGFYVDHDYRRYLAGLRETVIRYRCAVRAYVLMWSHVHFLVTPSSPAASRMTQRLGRQYVGYINGRYRRIGTLCEGRYKSCLVDTGRYLLIGYHQVSSRRRSSGRNTCIRTTATRARHAAILALDRTNDRALRQRPSRASPDMQQSV